LAGPVIARCVGALLAQDQDITGKLIAFLGFRIGAMWITGLVCASCLCAGVAWGQLPDLPGKDTTVKACSVCHEPERAASLHQTKDGWDATMTAMAGRGMTLSDADYTTVLDYLSKAFPAEAVPALNINKASGIDMESALGLLRSQAALLIAYREQHGNFKTLDDLKKVPGFDFSRVADKKDRISF
jgi:competence protein ComEA